MALGLLIIKMCDWHRPYVGLTECSYLNITCLLGVISGVHRIMYMYEKIPGINRLQM